MKRTFLIPLLVVIGLFVIASCKKNNKDEEPVADFTYTLLEHGGVQVTFTGKGEVTWDFGGPGAQIGSGNTVKYYYKSNGNRTITATAQISPTGSSKEKEQVVSISGVPTKVRLMYAKLYQYRTTDLLGTLWDNDATDPDVIFKYNIITTGTLTSTYPNLSTSALPLTYTLPTPLEFNITDLAFNTSGISYFPINVYCIDDTYSGTETIESVTVETSKVLPSCTSCSNTLYPSTYSSTSNGSKRLEIGLEWTY